MIAGQSQPDMEQLQSQIEELRKELSFCRHSLEDLLARQGGDQKPEYLKKILVKSNGSLLVLQTGEIDWIEAWGDYVRLHCKGKIYTVRQKIGELAKDLDPQQFIRIGRSAMVNIERIKEMEPLNHGDYLVILSDNTQLNLSRNYRNSLSALFGDHY
jgi:two-component system LytT family response regulator